MCSCSPCPPRSNRALSGQVLGTQLPGQYPGQYPGTTYPGGSTYPGGGQQTGPSWPGRNRKTNNGNTNNNAPAQTFIGRLRRNSNSEIALETDDHRVLTVGLGTNTKFFDDAGKSAASGDFFPGDRVSVDATSDDQSYLHAVRVRLERAGSSSDRAAAGQPVEESPVARGSVSSDGDGDRPKLKRAGSSDSQSSASSTASSTASNSDDPDRPVLRRKPDDTVKPAASSSGSAAKSSSAKSSDDDYVVPVDRSASSNSQSGSSSSGDDPDRPVLRRGKPTDTRTSRSSGSSQSSDDEPVLVATNRQPARPQVIDGDSETSPSNRRATAYSNPRAGDPIIEKAREAAFDFTETLPNYVVKQFTTRFYSESTRGKSTSWQAQDNVTADVVCEGGKESYKNILVNGKAPRENIEKTGSWSSGEFASVLQDVLSPATDARFFNKRSSTIVNRSATRFDFTVEQENSHWHVYASSQSYQPSYSGAIWIDKETSRVLRIEMSAKSMPGDFPLDTVESATDYDFVLISEGKFLLPVHSESLSCTRGSGQCSRNVIDFRNYRKFGADTSISFGADDVESTPKKKP